MGLKNALHLLNNEAFNEKRKFIPLTARRSIACQACQLERQNTRSHLTLVCFCSSAEFVVVVVITVVVVVGKTVEMVKKFA